MLKYIIRRILYMIPTVFGVILITFLLFNFAGGDPAVVKLGKNATAESLEYYDVQRGMDKPAILGMWGTTRAHYDSDFESGPGAWKTVEGVTYEREKARVVLPSGGTYPVPLMFPLRAGQSFRWLFRCRWTPDPDCEAGYARFVVSGEGSDAGSAVSLSLSEHTDWQTVQVPFTVGEEQPDLTHRFEVEGGQLEISASRLRRRTEHLFDSQLVFYLKQIARFDFGVSLETNQRVSRMILDGVLPSLALTVPMFIVGLALAISLALICAFFRNAFIDRFFVIVSVILMSVNYLVWIILGQYLLGYRLRWFPLWGFESWRYLLLPMIIGIVSGLGASLRFYRTVMLDEMYRDYVRTAFAKGVGRRGVLFRHVLKNAMIPILTSVILSIPFLFTGSLLLESFFGIPGLGNMAINGINNSDFDVIRALVFVGAMLYVVFNLITDVCYAAVDPRVKLK
jgi:peptide/nickel transport system permease protein